MYRLTDLGTLNGAPDSEATAINASGQVVGQSAGHAFLYSDGTMRDLGTLGGTISKATAINSEGQIVGFSDDSSGHVQPFLYSNGGMRALSPTLNGGFAYGINFSGQVVGQGGITVGATTYNLAFLYADGSVQSLGILQGATRQSSAAAINDLGQIVGESSVGPDVQHAFLYSNGTMHDLGTLGGNFAEAVAINNAGQIVGTSTISSGANRAFLYSGGVMHDLGPFGGTISGAVAINNRGQVLVQSDAFGTMDMTPFFYSDGATYQLNDLIVNAPPGYALRDASAINDSGEIVGTANVPGGAFHAVLLTPTSVPLPPAVWAALAAFPLLLSGRRLMTAPMPAKTRAD